MLSLLCCKKKFAVDEYRYLIMIVNKTGKRGQAKLTIVFFLITDAYALITGKKMKSKGKGSGKRADEEYDDDESDDAEGEDDDDEEEGEDDEDYLQEEEDNEDEKRRGKKTEEDHEEEDEKDDSTPKKCKSTRSKKGKDSGADSVEDGEGSDEEPPVKIGKKQQRINDLVSGFCLEAAAETLRTTQTFMKDLNFCVHERLLMETEFKTSATAKIKNQMKALKSEVAELKKKNKDLVDRNEKVKKFLGKD